MKAMTKGERILAEAMGYKLSKGEPVMTSTHPFLRKVTEFMADRKEWEGTATELLKEIDDSFTPSNTVTKLLNRYDCSHFYGRGISIKFHRTNRKRIISFYNFNYRK